MARARGSRSTEVILDAVTALLDERGPAEVTITDVVERAGVTRPTFYKAFGDLPTAYAGAAVRRIEAALAGEAAPDVPEEDRAAIMLGAIRRMLARVEPHADFFRRVLDGHGGHVVQRRVVHLLADEIATRTPVSAALARGPVPVEAAATAVAAGVAWTMLDWFAEEPRRPADEVAETVRDLVLHSVVGGLGAADVSTVSAALPPSP